METILTILTILIWVATAMVFVYYHRKASRDSGRFPGAKKEYFNGIIRS